MTVSVGSRMAVRSRGRGSRPLVVVDDRGGEVGVVVDYAQYMVLLHLVSSGIERGKLPRYWRRAVEDCLALRS